MKKLSLSLMILLAVSTIPAFAQENFSSEKEEKIRIEILECEKNISEDKTMTDAVKTVNKRQCSSEIRNKYSEDTMTYETQNEIKIKLQDLQRCDDWYSQYQYLDNTQFKIQKNTQMVESCIILYNDSLWKYDGADREKILSNRLSEIKSEIPIGGQSSDEFLKDAQRELDRIQNLEIRISELEQEIKNKDMIIREQMNVIVDLANSLKNIFYTGIQIINTVV